MHVRGVCVCVCVCAGANELALSSYLMEQIVAELVAHPVGTEVDVVAQRAERSQVENDAERVQRHSPWGQHVGMANVGQDPKLSPQALERGRRVDGTAPPLLLEQLDRYWLAIVASAVDLQNGIYRQLDFQP